MTNHVTFGQDGKGNVTEVACFSQAEAERIWISILINYRRISGATGLKQKQRKISIGF